MKGGAANWIIANVKGSFSGAGVRHSVPFAIWQRQWEVCDLSGDRTRSREISDKIRSLAEKDPDYLVASHLFDCQVAIYSAKYSDALQLAEKALALAEGNKDGAKRAEIYGQLSQAYQYLSNYDKAVEYRVLAAAIYEANKDENNLGNSWASLGLIYWKKGQFSQALSYLTKARQIFEKNQDDRSMALVLTNTANVLLATDETEKALEYYLSALAICRRIGDLAKQSSICNNLGAIMFRRAEYSRALEYYSQGLKLDEMLGNLTGQATKLNNIAVMLGSMGKHAEAMAYFERALRIDTTTGNLDGQMRKLGNIATIYAIIDDYFRAVEYIDRALEIGRKINSRSYYGHFLTQKIGYLQNLMDYQEAKRVGKEALEVVTGLNNHSQLATLYSSLADIYYDTGEMDDAYAYSSRAMEIIEHQELFEVYKENSYFTHSLVLEKLGKLEEADKYLKLAYDEVQEKTRNIRDEQERSGFLTKNKTISQIVEKWESTHKREA